MHTTSESSTADVRKDAGRDSVTSSHGPPFSEAEVSPSPTAQFVLVGEAGEPNEVGLADEAAEVAAELEDEVGLATHQDAETEAVSDPPAAVDAAAETHVEAEDVGGPVDIVQEELEAERPRRAETPPPAPEFGNNTTASPDLPVAAGSPEQCPSVNARHQATPPATPATPVDITVERSVSRSTPVAAPSASPVQPALLPSRTESRVGAQSAREEDHQSLLRRLWRSEELIKQLKHIVKAQHSKIEELRERLEYSQESHVQAMLNSQNKEDLARVSRENDEQRRKINLLQAELEQAKGENQTLRKANRRFKAMLEQQCQQQDRSLSESATISTRLERPQTGLPTAVVPLPPPPGCVTTGSVKSPAVLDECRLTTPARGSSLGPPAFPKSSRLISSMPMFWRDLDSPRAVLHALTEICGRVLSDRPSLVRTVYVIDPWLRAAAATEPKDAPPMVYYLGHGRTELQVLSNGGRPEPPQFSDVQALPYRSRTAIAVLVQMPNSRRQLAVFQAVASEETRPRTAVTTPRVLHNVLKPDECSEQVGFTDTQLAHLQIVCCVAGGILAHIERLDQRQRVLDRMRACVDVAVAMTKARSLPDFESRVKHQLASFFNVNIVRLLFYDAASERLLISSAQLRKKDCTAFPLDKGIVGLCARRQQVIYVGRISQHPYVDPMSDGLNRSGRPVAANAAMLCGPMLVDTEDGQEGDQLLGVVQLLERKRPGGQKSMDTSGEFSSEEQSLFSQLLRVCAHAAWRTLKVQELAAQRDGSATTLARMMTG